MTYAMTWLVWHGTRYCLAGLAWYMVCPRHGMVYGITWRGLGWYMVLPGGMICIFYGLEGMAWYMVWSGGHDMLNNGLAKYDLGYVIDWCGMAWNGLWGMT